MADDPKNPPRTMVGVGAGVKREPTPLPFEDPPPVAVSATKTGTLDASTVPEATVEATVLPAMPRTSTVLAGGVAKVLAEHPAPGTRARTPTAVGGSSIQSDVVPALSRTATKLAGGATPMPRTEHKPTAQMSAVEAEALARSEPEPEVVLSTSKTAELDPATLHRVVAASSTSDTVPPISKPAEPTVALAPNKPAEATVSLAPNKPSEATVSLGPATPSLDVTLPPGDLPTPTKARAATPLPLAYEDYVGQELCGYTIKRKLAEGGMGVVFEGVHGKIGRRGAIKLLKLEFCRSDEVVERFHQEARAVNAIRHENIVDVFDFGRDAEGRAFFVMEYLEGEPLSARIKRGAIPWSEAFPILEQTLRALKAAHDKGFVHRDLKPDNIWLRPVDGGLQVKLLDFGIAKLVGSDSPKEKLTQTGSVMGTPHYMSPEQINGSKDIDDRTDIYALGVITYEMFAGVTPFVGDTLQAIMTGHLFKEPPRLADIPSDLGVPAPIAEIIDRMLVKDAAQRYANVSDVLADLRDVHKQRQPTKAETLAKTSPTRPTRIAASLRAGSNTAPTIDAPATIVEKKKPRRGAMIGLAITAVVAAAGVVTYKTTRPEPAAVATPTPTPPPTPPPTPTPPKPAVALDFEQLRRDAQTTLRASLAETEPVIRVQGSDALGKLKDGPAIPQLAKLTEADPDAEVRGHTADALGSIGAADTAPLMARLEKLASPALKVWYASALARLGDRGAKQRLLGYAKQRELAIAFKAALTLADVSQPGDAQAIKALRALAAQEAELNQIAPYAGAVILTKLAALKDPQARKILYTILEAKDEGARLAAAEGLAKLGDDGGKKILAETLANEASPNRLVGAVAMIPLGDYTGFDFIASKLDDKDPETRRLALRALGEIGERKSLAAMVTMMQDRNWSIRIAAAAAIVAIVGLDPQVLAQASIDWTRGALASQDWAVRKAAAGVLGDMPEKEAVPLLAQAIADPDANVRLAASKSAGKMRTAEAASSVAAAAKREKNPEVRVQQVRSLGEIGSPVARDTLVELTSEPGTLGVYAAGSLIAVGDASGKAKLDAAVVDRSTDIRLAAVEAAGAAKNPIVVPTLKTGVADRVFEIRLTAAEGLARFGAEKAAAVPVLETGLASKDPGVVGRASASLIAFGEQPKAAQTPAEMLDSPDPKTRLAVVGIVRAMPSADALPLIRRLVGDAHPDVRRAGVEAIETVVGKDKDQAIRLYKPLVTDEDAVVRSRASGQLSRIAPAAPPSPTKAAAAAAPAPPPPPTPAPADPMIAIKAASAVFASALADAQAAVGELDKLADEIGNITAVPAKDDDAVKEVEAKAATVTALQGRIDGAIAKLAEAVDQLAAAAGAAPPPDAAPLLAEAKAGLAKARQAGTAAKGRGDRAGRKIKDYAKAETGDAQMFIASADAAIASGNLTEAKRDLDKAAASMKVTGAKNAGLDYSYAQLFDKQATRTQDPAQKLKLLQQAVAAYQRFARAGTGSRVQRARDRAAELAEDIQELTPQ